MAYLGSTQATSLANPPRLLVGSFAGLPGTTQLSTGTPSDGSRSAYNVQGGNLWYYASSHGSTEVADTDFFTDAQNLGIRPGDILMGLQWTTLGSSLVLYMGAFLSVSSAGACITTGGSFSSTHA